MKKIGRFFKIFFEVLNKMSILISLFVYFSAKPYFGDLVLKQPAKNTTVQVDSSHQQIKGTIATIANNQGVNKQADFYTNFFAITAGILCGLIAFIMPGVYVMVPVTISYITKASKSRRLGIRNGLIYSASVFLLFSLVSIPFLLFGNIDPVSYQSIFTKPWVNIIFLLITLVFGLSFLGFFELSFPSRIAFFSDNKSGLKSISSVFFMALTFVLVSFSSVSPIISLLIINLLPYGVLTLLKSILCFAAVITVPYIYFTFFPASVQLLPRSGNWLGFIKKGIAIVMLLLSLKFLYPILVSFQLW